MPTPPLSCESVRRDLAAFHEGDLASPQSIAIEAHLVVCAPCGATRAEMQRFDRWLDSESTPSASTDFIDRTVDAMVKERMNALAASPEFVDGTVDAMLRERSRRRARPWVPYLVSAATLAAAALLFLRTGPAETPRPGTNGFELLTHDRASLYSGRLTGARSANDLDLPALSTDHLVRLVSYREKP